MLGLSKNIGQKADKFVEQAKSVAIAGVVAAFFGLAGVFLLAGSLAALLAMWLPLPAALLLTAITFLSVTSIALWLGSRPVQHKDVDKDHDGVADEGSIESALHSMTDLPMEVARKIIADRPIAALAIFSGFGMLIARRPEIAIRLVERLMARFT